MSSALLAGSEVCLVAQNVSIVTGFVLSKKGTAGPLVLAVNPSAVPGPSAVVFEPVVLSLPR